MPFNKPLLYRPVIFQTQKIVYVCIFKTFYKLWDWWGNFCFGGPSFIVALNIVVDSDLLQPSYVINV